MLTSIYVKFIFDSVHLCLSSSRKYSPNSRCRPPPRNITLSGSFSAPPPDNLCTVPKALNQNWGNILNE